MGRLVRCRGVRYDPLPLCFVYSLSTVYSLRLSLSVFSSQLSYSMFPHFAQITPRVRVHEIAYKISRLVPVNRYRKNRFPEAQSPVKLHLQSYSTPSLPTTFQRWIITSRSSSNSISNSWIPPRSLSLHSLSCKHLLSNLPYSIACSVRISLLFPRQRDTPFGYSKG